MKKKKIAFVLGLRPDLIRAALILKHLERERDIETIFIWSGQNYSDNLKGIFFRELGVRNPDIDLKCRGENDAQVVSKLIAKLYPVLEDIKPDAVAFLGDTNTAIGCIAALQLNIPIFHIEGCWHSYDWRMPEEKYRTLADHMSDVIYTYAQEYKERGIKEGLNPKNIVVTGHPVIDLLDTYYFSQEKRLTKMANEKFFSDRGIERNNYLLMTCHRRENVHIDSSFKAILNLLSKSPYKIYFPASYRTQNVIKEKKFKLPKNVTMVDPIGYEEILVLMKNSKGVITDSGTLNEEACVLQIPCINMRKATERPQVYDTGGCIKFDSSLPNKYPPELIFKKLEKISGKKWKQPFGEKGASKAIAQDIAKRLREDRVQGHLPENSHLPLKRSFMEDGIKI